MFKTYIKYIIYRAFLKKPHFLTLSILFLNSFLHSQVQSKYDNNAIMPLYGLYNADLDNLPATKLRQLSEAGFNTLVMAPDTNDYTSIINKFKTYPKLKNFKLMISLCTLWHDAYVASNYSDDLNSPTLSDYKKLMDAFILSAKKNPDVVSGYYTFDEPVIALFKNNTRGISKEFQIAVYNYIRNQDPDIVSRPVCLANTMHWESAWVGNQDDIIKKSISNDAQDIIFIDQYSSDDSVQKNWFEKWISLGITDPFVYILNAYSDSCKSEHLVQNTASAIKQAIAKVYVNGATPPTCKGIGAFAYWPGKKPDFNYGMDNCESIYKETLAFFEDNYYGNCNWSISSDFCEDGSIILNSSGKTKKFGIRICKTDANGKETESAMENVISNIPLDGYSVTKWCNSIGYVLQPNNYYRISICAGHQSLYTESSKLIYYKACTWNLISEENGQFNGWSPQDDDLRIAGDFDGDTVDELFMIQKPGNLSRLLKFKSHNKTWNSLYGNATGPIANSWRISTDDNFLVGDFDADGKDEILFCNPNGWSQMIEYLPSLNQWQVQWNNQGNGKIGNWDIEKNMTMLSGDFDNDVSGKEVLFIQNTDLNASAMIQKYSNGNWENQPIWKNSGNGFITGWGIHAGDRFIIGDLDGNKLNNDVLCINNGAWTGIESFNTNNKNFVWAWNNGGTGYTHQWGMISTSDKVLAGNIDAANINDELIFINTGSAASKCMTQTLDDQFHFNNLWFNNGGDPAQISNWPLYSQINCKQDYLLFRTKPNEPKKLLATRTCPGSSSFNLYEVIGLLNKVVSSTPSSSKSISINQKNAETALPKLIPYPNPSSNGTFHVFVPNETENSFTLEVFDLHGNKLLNTELNKGENEITMGLNQKGIFIAKIFSNGVIPIIHKININKDN